MKNVSKKMLTFASLMGVVTLLSGCMMECPGKKHHHKKVMHSAPQAVEVIESDTIVVYQTHENADVNHVYAKMYTHSSRGGESKMGHIKFKETDNGLKMTVDLKDLRPGVQYHVKLYQCSSCYNDARCCNNSKMLNVQLPMLQTGMSGRLNQAYMIQGMTAEQLEGANIYLERDGGYKAGWGKLEK